MQEIVNSNTEAFVNMNGPYVYYYIYYERH